MPRKPADPPELVAERKRKRTGKVSKARLNTELEIGLRLMYDYMGGVRWLVHLAKNKPALAVQLLCKYAGKEDAEIDSDIRYVVQQFTINAAPIAGVTNSPIVGHVSAPRLAASNGEVVDAEVKKDG